MSVVAPITLAWQGIVDANIQDQKEVETFDDLEKAVERARTIVNKAKDLQNNDYVSSNPLAHITLHPGTYSFGQSISQSTKLKRIYITALPGAELTDFSSDFTPETKSNIVNLNSLAQKNIFGGSDSFVFDKPVRFEEEVIFDQNQFPVKKVEAGIGIEVSNNFGDVTVSHGNTGASATTNNNENTFLNKIEFDDFGHVENVGFGDFDPSIDVQNDGGEVLSDILTINFTDNLSASSPEQGTANIRIPGTEDFKVSDFKNYLPVGKPLSKISGTSGEKAKLSKPPQGYSKNEVFPNDTETERGVIGPQQAVEGILNPQVKATNSHDSKTFSRASTGTLKLLLNGSSHITVNLNQTGSAITVTSNSGSSSLSVSPTSPLLFPNESNFEDVTQRTGNWEVSSQEMNEGLNEIQIVHEDQNGSVIGQSQKLYYYVDTGLFEPKVFRPNLSVSSLRDVKMLSGVAYNKKASVDVEIATQSIYRNVYGTGNAIKYPKSTYLNLSSEEIPELGQNEDESSDLFLQKTLDLDSDRILKDKPLVQAKIEDPIEGEIVSPKSDEDLEFLVDGITRKNEATTHFFDNENLRMGPNEDFSGNVSINSYDSTKSIKDGGPEGYDSELQVTNGKIVYPSIDYNEIKNGPNNPNYSEGVSERRTYYGVFTSPTASSNFVLNVRGNGKIFSPRSLSSNNEGVAIAIRVPTQTGWLDVNKPFVAGNFENGDGAYQETNAKSPSLTIGKDSEIGLTIGTKNTADGYNKLYYRIIAPEFWTGEITKMNIRWKIGQHYYD